MLSQVTNFLKRNKKIMYYLGFFAVIYFALGDSVFAAEEWDSATDTINGFITALNFVFKFLSIIIWVLTNFIGLFLNPSWTNGTVLWLQTHLKELWILVSNIVYFIFAILIVVIAFMNIIGKWDKWELKQALPKFIVWVLIVPFSWFFVQFIISLSSILTATVLALPYDTLKTSSVKLNEIDICTNLYIDDGSKSGSGMTQTCTKYLKADELMQWNNVFWMLGIYTYGIFAIDETTKLFQGDIEGTTNTLAWLGFKTVFNMLMVLIYWILVISLWLALFVRWMWLWLYMIFSPVFWLLYFFWKEKEWIGWKFSITEFISLALVPVYVAWALAFGLLFIFVAGQWLWGWENTDVVFSVTSTDAGTEEAITEWKHTWTGTIVVTLLEKFSVEMWGSLANSASPVKWINDVLNGFKGALWTIIMQLFGLAVLWISIMAALASNKITEEVVKPIAEFWKSVWGLAMKAPQYMPIFWGQSMSSIKTAWGAVTSSMQTKQNTMGNEFAEKHFGWMMWNDKDKEYRRIWASVPSNIDQTLKNISELNKNWTSKDIANSNTAIQSYVMNLDKLKSQNWFTKPEEAEKLINELKWAWGNPAKVAEILAKLDDLGSTNRSILWGDKKVTKDQVDDYLGSKATWYVANDDFKPLPQRVPTNRENWEIKLTIDSNTQIYTKADGSFKDDNEKKILINHLVDKDKAKTMKLEDIKPWLENHNIGTETERNEIINEVEKTVTELSKDDKSKFTIEDYFIQKDDEKPTS